MKKLLFLLIAVLVFSPGCLVIYKINYTIEMKTEKKGTATVRFYDIRSDAIGNREFEEDKKNLFEYLYRGGEIIESLKSEGKYLMKRTLDVNDNKLNGVAVYDFDDINKVEGIRYESGLYYLTLQTEDSVLTTNGSIEYNPLYKRIIWSGDAKKLQFEILADKPERNTRELVSHFRKLK
ncbi:MAG: hypothetical protein HUU54_04810 [Ignavibacteriaceae bacterium]|nr:hypothetical protein [Ignavibacteriaceae bacterium]